ncbi:MAG: hypothetical protein ACR2FU_23975, partial [Streptosporangiaceae bacterium]
MTWPIPPAALLHGPRGRRLCWELVQSALLGASDWSQRERLGAAAQRGDLSGVAGDLAACTADAAQTVLPGEDDDAGLLAALAAVTQQAMYWQQPDPEDIALEDPAVRVALRPVAAALAQDSRASWWSARMDPASQQRVQRAGAAPVSLTGGPAALGRWRAAEAADERAAASRPEDPAASWSGHWWSGPAPARLLWTSRTPSAFGSSGLAP